MIKLSSVYYKNVFKYVVEEGNRLRERLPEYLEQRRALLMEHSPLIPPLRTLVHDYAEPRRTFDLWATGLGADPQHEKPAKRRRKAETIQIHHQCNQPKRPHLSAREKTLCTQGLSRSLRMLKAFDSFPFELVDLAGTFPCEDLIPCSYVCLCRTCLKE
jgi:hypothetical protein